MSGEDDIREIFRRAFEQAEGRRTPNGELDEEGGEPPNGVPRRQTPSLPSGWWKDRRLWIGLIFFIIFVSFNGVITAYTDWLWFTNIGYVDVWLTSWGAKLITFAVFFVVAILVLWLNVQLALRGAKATSQSAFQPSEFAGFRVLLMGGAAFLAFSFASAAGSMWEQFLQFIYRTGSETVDPIFGKSLTFYFFELPVYSFIRGWFMPLIFFSLLAVVAIYAVHNLEHLRTNPIHLQTLAPLRRHVAILATILALLIATGHFLDRYKLLLKNSGTQLVAGAGYTDINVTSRILLINATLMLIVAAALLLNIQRLNLRLLVVSVGLWFLSLFILTGIVPSIVERYVVKPNQLTRESPYLQYNIDSTRKAFGLDQIEVRDFGTVNPLTSADLSENADALTNIRLWDYRVLPDNYEQLQALRPYYQFSDVDIDRYEIDGVTRQVMLSARELNKSAIGNQSWENLHLEFTHGYGLVMNPVDRFTRDGQPEFFISDIPPVSTTEIEITRPEIYYGEKNTADDIVFVGSPRGEFDYPFGETNERTTYTGKGGVAIGGFLRKLAFAIRFGEINILINDDITPETRVMFNRNIKERIKKITPEGFLIPDSDPYVVVADGRVYWMIDAYTVSNSYPYSGSTQGRINYIRNAAKIVVDAYDGTVTYYLVDQQDPIVSTYARIFPNLFRPLSEMPASLQSHIRYPEQMFRIQASQYLKYHMTNLNVFFNKEDLWAIPKETFKENESEDMEPYYVDLTLPGEDGSEYLLIQPYTAHGKTNMVAWMAARNDAENYGELVVYTLPKQQVVDGPIQIEAQIEQDSEISSQLSLWNEGSSQVIRGNLIVIPLNNSFLYIEPLYLQSEGAGARPELKRVIAASGGDVVMEKTLGEALAALVNTKSLDFNAPTSDGISSTSNPPTITTTDLTGLSADDAVQAVIESANANFAASQAAQQAGDWAAYGEALDALEADLQQLSELTGSEE